MTVTDADAAHAWAKHRKLDLEQIRTQTLGQVAAMMDGTGRPVPWPTPPIPAYVLRTLADLERQAQPQERTDLEWTAQLADANLADDSGERT